VTLLAVFQEAATVIGMDVPDSVYGSSAREHQELAVLANTMGRRIARAYEWQELKRTATIIGDGVAGDFALPADFDRMPKQASLWSDDIPSPFTHVTNYDKWLELLTLSFSTLANAWTLLGGRIHVMPTLGADQAATYYYQSKLYALGAGGEKARFDADTDAFVLNEELLKLGIIWQWKANKGHAYAEDMANYEELLSTLVATNIGPRRIRIGVARMPTDAVYAYPGTVGMG
jgi:hypothetical protein